MKKIKNLLFLLMPCALLVGCGTTQNNPNYNPSLPKSTENEPFVENTNAVEKVQAAVATFRAVNESTAPLNPYSPLIDTVLTLVAGGIGTGASVWLRMKNALASQRKATQTLANVVVGAGGGMAALANAPDNATAALIASHIQDAPLPNTKPATPPVT